RSRAVSGPPTSRAPRARGSRTSAVSDVRDSLMGTELENSTADALEVPLVCEAAAVGGVGCLANAVTYSLLDLSDCGRPATTGGQELPHRFPQLPVPTPCPNHRRLLPERFRRRDSVDQTLSAKLPSGQDRTRRLG